MKTIGLWCIMFCFVITSHWHIVLTWRIERMWIWYADIQNIEERLYCCRLDFWVVRFCHFIFDMLFTNSILLDLTESFQNIICYLFKQSYSRQSIWKLIDSRTMVCTKYHILVHDIWYLFRKNFIPKSVYISYILNVKGCLKQVW